MNGKTIGSIALILGVGLVAFSFIQKKMKKEDKTGASGVKWTKGKGCLHAKRPDWNKSKCIKGGGSVNENIGRYGSCCY
jgi:hypothetical protein